MKGSKFYLAIFGLLGGIFILLGFSIYLISERVITPVFLQAEKTDYHTKMEILENAIKANAENLKVVTVDYGEWDDTYEFVVGKDPTYIDDNSENLLYNLKIDFFVILNNDYQVVYFLTYDQDGNQIDSNIDPVFQEAAIQASKYFVSTKPALTDAKEFFFSYGDNIAHTSVITISNSVKTAPGRGYMLAGTIYNKEQIDALSNRNSLKLALDNFAAFQKKSPALAEKVEKEGTIYEYPSQKEATGYYLVRDYNDKPAAVISSFFERNINDLVMTSRFYYLLEIYITVVVALAISMFLYNRILVSRRKQFEGETKYELLFNQNVMPLVLVKLDKAWHWTEIVEANKAASSFYGFEENDAYHKRPINLLYGMEDRAVGDFLTNLSNIGIAVDQTDLFVNGAKLTVELIGRTFDVSDKKYLLISIKDLSERVEYERKLEDYADNLKKFQLAVQNASDQIVITDSDGIIIYGNESVKTITGFEINDVIGRKAGSAELWGGQMPDEYYKEMWRTIKTDRVTFQNEIRNKRQDGTAYDAAISITPILDDKGAVIFFVGIERDITKAKEIDRAKTEFVSLASHQLRTPLSAINWYTEMLMDQDSGKINETQKEYLLEIYKGNKRMVDLVNSLLNVSRIDMGTFDINTEPINVVDLAEDVFTEMTPQIKAKDLRVETDFAELPMVMLDPKLTRIIIQNLVSNAIKYTPPKGKVKLDIDKEDDKCIVITVEDTGYGIPRKQQDKVFSKLFRADNVQALDTEGTGLGLYIVKSIIDNAGGEISFESEEGKGTTFVVKLPFAGMREKTGTKSLDV